MQHGSSAAMCQLNCTLLAQMKLANSTVRSAATCQLSCTLLAQMTLVISAATCWLSCSLSSLGLAHSAAIVNTAVYCQLGCDMSAQQSYVSSAATSQLTAACPVAVSSMCPVWVKLLAQRHNAFNVAHTRPSLQSDRCCR